MASSLVLLTMQATALDDPPPCRRENPRLWFSDLPADLQLAKAYCQPCPIRRACLAAAVERHELHGVWGGEIFAPGAIITEQRPRGRPPGDRGQLSEVAYAASSHP
jgi:WhiB family redox-sensing transcriptional regulator